MGKDLLVFQEAVINKVDQARHALVSRRHAQSLTAVTTVSESDFFHTTDSVTVDMDFVKRYLSLLSCLAGNVYSVSSAYYETFAESTSSCKPVVKIKVQ